MSPISFFLSSSCSTSPVSLDLLSLVAPLLPLAVDPLHGVGLHVHPVLSGWDFPKKTKSLLLSISV